MKDPLSSSLNESSVPPMNCCVQLRCKTIFYRPDERPGRLHYSDTQNYWCEITHDPQGPDAAEADPRTCQSGRPCYCAPPG